MTETTVGPPSADTRPRSRPMQLVGEKQLPDPPPMRRSMQKMMATPATISTETESPIPPPELTNQELVNRAAWRAGVLGAVNVITRVLSARLIVLVAVSGGIGLTWTALAQPDLYRLAVLGVYALGVAVPAVWLASR